MSVSKATRTHLIYQFIILTILLLGIGYNELLPDRKFLILLAILPIICYQLVILSCCMELMQFPSWMSFLLQNDEKCDEKRDSIENDFDSSATDISSLNYSKKIASFPEVNEISSYHRRWEKSVMNLGTSPKHFDFPQKSKSWMNLSDSKSTESLSREGSLDALVALTEREPISRVEKSDKTRKREERNTKAKSWRLSVTDFDISDENGFTYYKEPPMKTHAEFPSLKSGDDEPELSKSYSFPIRQKRLETWLEMNESSVAETNQSPGIPYWKSVGYNLAVKYEARRRRRAISGPTTADVSDEPQKNVQKPIENVSDFASIHKSHTNGKKPVKSVSARINKVKIGFSNLISKKKEDSPDRKSLNPNKASKSALFKSKNKNTPSKGKDDKLVGMPEFPQFLSNDRPLIFYPRNIPFEKERFESDVKKKMKELSEEPQNNYLQKIK